MKELTLPIDLTKLKKATNLKRNKRLRRMIYPIASITIILTLLSTFALILCILFETFQSYTFISFIMFSIFVVLTLLTTYVYSRLKGGSQQVSEETTDKLNRIIRFKNGHLIPQYHFIDFETSTRSDLKIKIDYDSKIETIFSNEYGNDPERNADIDDCRKQFPYLSQSEMTDYLNSNLPSFAENKAELLKIYDDTLDETLELMQYANTKTVDTKLLTIHESITLENELTANELGKLHDKQEELIKNIK